MTALSPGLDAALAGDSALVTLFIETVLPSYTMRLLVGSGSIAWGGHNFVSDDATYGSLAAIEEIEDGEGDDAPTFGMTILPPSDSAAAALSSPDNQNASVKVWLAAIDRATGLVIADPYLIKSLLIDQPILKVGKSARAVDLECVDAFDRLLEDDEGARISDAWQQSIWPGETGCANVTGIERSIYWGMAAPTAGPLSFGSSGITANPISAVIGKHP